MVSLECREGLPLEYEPFLIEKYDSFITTCKYIEINYSSYELNYILVHEDNILIDLLVFGNKGNTCICFNSLARIDQKVITEFSKRVFELFPGIVKIEIRASYIEYSLEKSFLNFNDNDQILNLPSTVDEYYKQLGSSTRQRIRNRRGRLSKDFPDIQFAAKYGEDIDESIVDQIIDLNCARMKSKGSVPGIAKEDRKKIYDYSKVYGCVVYIEINGKLVAGCISTILNKSVFMHVFSHDNDFSKYNLGEVCMFYLIQTSIESEMTTFHFLWGRTEFKKRLLGQNNELYFYYIFRSYSINYLVSRTRILLSNIVNVLKESSILEPLKRKIKSFRIKKWQDT
jgi:hypothetical protein